MRRWVIVYTWRVRARVVLREALGGELSWGNGARGALGLGVGIREAGGLGAGDLEDRGVDRAGKCYLAAWRMGRGAWFMRRRCSLTEPVAGTSC